MKSNYMWSINSSLGQWERGQDAYLDQQKRDLQKSLNFVSRRPEPATPETKLFVTKDYAATFSPRVPVLRTKRSIIDRIKEWLK